MVDGVLLLVDASEGPLPQTRYVLRKALESRLPPVVVINKIDRADARPKEVLNEVYDLFIDLDATEDQLDFPVLYTNAKQGFARTAPDGDGADLRPLFDALVKAIPAPSGSPDDVLQLLIANLDYSDYLGRLAIGRVFSGKVTVGDTVAVSKRDGRLETTKVTKLFVFDGLERWTPTRRPAARSWRSRASRGSRSARRSPRRPIPSRCRPAHRRADDLDGVLRQHLALRRQGGPLRHLAQHQGPAREGAAHERLDQGRAHRLGRLLQGARPRRAAALDPDRDDAARGLRARDLQPRGAHEDRGRQAQEPQELFSIDLPETYMGVILEKMALRKGKMAKMVNHGSGRVRLEFQVPTRGLIGVRTELLTDTRGTAVMNSLLEGWAPWQGEIPRRQTGVLVADRAGDTTAYALSHLEDRGEL
jgi:GTP-binding protein